MLKRIVATCASVVLVLLGLAVSPAGAAGSSGHASVTAQMIQDAVSADGLLRVTNVTVTSTSSGTVSASATVYAGASTTPVAVALTYTDSNNWTVNVQRNGAGAGYAPTSPTSLDINDVDGTITRAAGRMSYQLVLHGYVMGDGTFDMSVYIDSTGWVANTIVEDLQIGGMTLEHASIEVSTIDAFAEMQASLETTGGSFDADITVTKPGNATPGQYTLSIDVEGADLKGASPTFQVNSFSFHYDVTTPTSGCTTIDTQAAMSVTTGSTTYSLNNVHVVVRCTTLTTFEFSLTVSHYQEWNGVTKAGTLDIAWYGTPGTFDMKYTDDIRYQSGFFGSLNLSASRTFSKKYRDRTFHRGVLVGIGFGVAVYQKSPGAQYTGGAIAGGYFDADRVSGDIGCAFISNDFRCGGELRLNPSWAGIYHYTWDNL